MEYVLDNVEGGYDEPVDPQHLDTVMEGMIDTVAVAGVESFNGQYTKAQQYLWSCMDSSDTINYLQRRQGIEGLVGDSMTAAWEFVKKIFTGIWNFFFGDGEGSSKSEVEATQKAVKENKEEIKKHIEPSTPEEKKETAKKVKASAQQIKKDPKASAASKKQAEVLEAEIDEAMKSDEPMKIDGRKFVTDLVKARVGSPSGMEKFNSACKAVEDVLAAGKVELETDNTAAFKGDTAFKKTYIDERSGLLEVFTDFPNKSTWGDIKKIHDPESAKKAQDKLDELLEMLKAATDGLREHKNDLNEKIKTTGALVKSSAEAKAEEKVTKNLHDMRILGREMAVFHRNMKALFGRIRAVSDQVNRVVGAKK